MAENDCQKEMQRKANLYNNFQQKLPGRGIRETVLQYAEAADTIIREHMGDYTQDTKEYMLAAHSPKYLDGTLRQFYQDVDAACNAVGIDAQLIIREPFLSDRATELMEPVIQYLLDQGYWREDLIS